MLIGVPLLKSAKYSNSFYACVKLGISIPIAFAPFFSIIGDYYEMGSILTSRIFHLFDPAIDINRWRSDDIFNLINKMFVSGSYGAILDIFGITTSLFLGIILAFLIYYLGHLWSRLILKQYEQ